jgi:peroxiredoxin
MVTTLCLLTCALATAQSADRSEWLLGPRLTRGQELVYRGTFEENNLGQGVQCQRTYRLENSLFVLDATARGYDTAVFTMFELRAFRQERGKNAAAPSSVRLEMARISPQGGVEGLDGASVVAPLEGPPTVECGALVEMPRLRVARGDVWDVAEPGRPPRHWKVVGSDTINNTSCLRLVGVQKSEHWDQGRADCSSWQRRDTVWIAPALGIAYRVERTLERRDPACDTPSYRAAVRYDLVSRLTYPGNLFRDRQREIWQARRFLDEAIPFLRKPAQYESHLKAILKKIDSYQERQPPIAPYCKAIQHLKVRLEAAKRGDVAPEPVAETGSTFPAVATIGQRAPDFVATDFIQQKAVRLHRLLGQPILLLFYNPNSPTAADVLHFAAEKQYLGVTVVGMAVTSDAEAVKKLHAALHLTFPVLAGNGFQATYGVDATPRIVLLDKAGIIRGAYTGWGTPTPDEVSAELRRWLPKKTDLKSPGSQINKGEAAVRSQSLRIND